MHDDISWLFPLADMLAPNQLRAVRLVILFGMWSSLSAGRTWTAQTPADDVDFKLHIITDRLKLFSLLFSEHI